MTCYFHQYGDDPISFFALAAAALENRLRAEAHARAGAGSSADGPALHADRIPAASRPGSHPTHVPQEPSSNPRVRQRLER